MATFQDLTQTETNEHHRRVFEIIAGREHSGQVEDGAQEITLDASEINEIKNELYGVVHDGLADLGEVQSATEMKQALQLKTRDKINAVAAAIQQGQKITQDGYYNPVSGIGTAIDPGMATESFVPVSITPDEATSYYASGGIPARIIDKKAGCLLLSGLKFECADFSPEDLAQLEDYAEKCGFVTAFREGVTQALIFGGAAVYPMLAGDNPLTTQKSRRELLEQLPEKDFIKYWVNADRWNVVFVPDYNITAQDYLYSRSVFVPLGGVRVNTQRVAMVRPRKLPFWAAIRQMGWATSDFEGWIKDFESYEIMKASLPIMAQQMSLMYHSFPADGLIMENGPEYAKRFFKQNEQEMREWSILHPKAINSVGEIKILERTYSGFQQLISEARLALSASSYIPGSILFAEKSTGLASDNRDDVELKQSEAIRLLFNNVAPAFANCIELLVYSCFGKNSKQAKHARDVKIAADSGVVLSDMDKAQLGQAFTGIIGQLSAVGLPVGTAAEIAHKFVPSADLNDDLMDALRNASAEFPQGVDQDLWATISQGRGNPGQGMGAIFGNQQPGGTQ